jgi:hypothetical protein
MFTWICPQCGREVPPSYSECPDCSAKEKAPESPPAAAQPQRAAPKPAAPPAQPNVQYVAVKRKQPVWLVTLGVAIGLVAIGAGAYYYLPSQRARREAAKPEITLETPEQAKAGAPAKKSGSLEKYLEVVGLRILEENRKPVIRFLVVNHSNAEMADLRGTVTVHASNAAPGSAPISTVDLKLDSLGANASVEVSAPLKTSLRAYEMPDWQFLRADLALAAP